ncbi:MULTISPECIES: hypothetical protein [Pseudomonas]|uniref:hypothetical protein n=1 Tax=Pseudomonas TaxID=286 RepID=UPI0011B04BED|nr:MULTISPECIES: hypothetical protein [Pseudomonas]WLG48263.1 hypothetical protein PSH64_16025 [Pseudomonas sp. FP1742]
MSQWLAGQAVSGECVQQPGLNKADKRQNHQDDHNGPDDIDNIVHENHLWISTGLRHYGA